MVLPVGLSSMYKGQVLIQESLCLGAVFFHVGVEAHTAVLWAQVQVIDRNLSVKKCRRPARYFLSHVADVV